LHASLTRASLVGRVHTLSLADWILSRGNLL